MIANVNKGCLISVLKNKDNPIFIADRKRIKIPQYTLKFVCLKTWMEWIFSKNTLLFSSFFLQISGKTTKVPGKF